MTGVFIRRGKFGLRQTERARQRRMPDEDARHTGKDSHEKTVRDWKGAAPALGTQGVPKTGRRKR